MTQLELVRSKKAAILALAAKHGARNVRVFGSVARGEERSDSDIDLLVDMEEGRTYFDLVDLWLETQTLMGRKVDVLTEPEVSPYIRKQVLKEAVPL